MKQLTCEMCGSVDLIKQDDVFLCQFCGTKYSVEEAKKMMIEGTVKIDDSDELKNLYLLARRAKDEKNDENAAKYYDMIVAKDPNSWEALFYSSYYRATCCSKVEEISDAMDALSKCCTVSVLPIIKNSIVDSNEQIKACSEISEKVNFFASKMYILYEKKRETVTDHFGPIEKKFGICEYNCINCILSLGDKIDEFFSEYKEMNDESVNLWKKALSLFGDIYPTWIIVCKAVSYSFMLSLLEKYIEKIQRYEPEYFFQSSHFTLQQLKKDATNERFNSTNGYYKTGGCYVATAVYGSYDCPQVWTLRRYRDYTLAETWYGRAFIRTYYAVSPTLVKWFGHTKWFKKIWKGKLDRMVAKLQSKGVESTPYEDRNW